MRSVLFAVSLALGASAVPAVIVESWHEESATPAQLDEFSPIDIPEFSGFPDLPVLEPWSNDKGLSETCFDLGPFGRFCLPIFSTQSKQTAVPSEPAHTKTATPSKSISPSTHSEAPTEPTHVAPSVKPTPAPPRSSSSHAAPKSTVAPPKASPAPTGASSPSSAVIQEYLVAHNNERANHGAAPLQWDASLAVLAAKWTAQCQFHHSGGTLASFPYGENLAAGSLPGSFNATAAVQSWNNERSQYNPNDPQASHWTQVVWKATKNVGCASSQCATGTVFSSNAAIYHSCAYTPPGNNIAAGEFAANVQA